MGEWEISSGGRYRRLERGRLRGEEIGRQGKHLGKESEEAEKDGKESGGDNQELKGVGEGGLCHPMIVFADVPALASF